MANFTSMAQAASWGRTRVENRTVTEAHEQRDRLGVISVRVLRKMAKVAIGAGPDFKGDWVIVTDDTWTP